MKENGELDEEAMKFWFEVPYESEYDDNPKVEMKYTGECLSKERLYGSTTMIKNIIAHSVRKNMHLKLSRAENQFGI